VLASAELHNKVQQYVIDNTRLAIPLSLSTVPRHAFTDNTGTGALAGQFSEWPETTGLAALRSADLVRTFATIAWEEYLEIGIRASLHPQIDLLTEPRWARGAATFGESAELTAELLVAYISFPRREDRAALRLYRDQALPRRWHGRKWRRPALLLVSCQHQSRKRSMTNMRSGARTQPTLATTSTTT
jgi:hypothetical protein